MRSNLTVENPIIATAARRLIAALGLRQRLAAEVQDLYSRPLRGNHTADLATVLRLTRQRQRPAGPDLAA
jgi:hypothetical protein